LHTIQFGNNLEDACQQSQFAAIWNYQLPGMERPWFYQNINKSVARGRPTDYKHNYNFLTGSYFQSKAIVPGLKF
jgi:hypothetical protein